MYVDATALYGNTFGSGTGPIAAVCRNYYGYAEFATIGNCSSSPHNLSTCTHEQDVGVRCSKGQCKHMMILSSTAVEDSVVQMV